MVCLVEGDICSHISDVIVNPGNETLLGCFTPRHTCLDHQIHEKAGPQLSQVCREIMQGRQALPGQCIITPSFQLGAICEWILHAFGPNCTQSPFRENLVMAKQCLRETYLNCLTLASENKLRSIAFPAIATGLYRFDPDLAAQIAVETTRNWLQKTGSSMRVAFVMWPENYKRYRKVLSTLT